MSQENVELVKATIEAYIAGDRDAFLDFCTEDVEGYLTCPVFPRQSRFAVARSTGASSRKSRRVGRVAQVQ
jgi:hypothetical protein